MSGLRMLPPCHPLDVPSDSTAPGFPSLAEMTCQTGRRCLRMQESRDHAPISHVGMVIRLGCIRVSSCNVGQATKVVVQRRRPGQGVVAGCLRFRGVESSSQSFPNVFSSLLDSPKSDLS